MKFLALSVLTLSFNLVFAQGDIRQSIKESYPSYEEAYSYLYNEIEQTLDGTYNYRIAKKQDGYHLIIQEYSDEKMVQMGSWPVWSSKSKEYLKFDISEFTTPGSEPAESKPKLEGTWYQRTYSDFMYFYGYGSWSQDIIDLLEGVKSPSSEECEMLARAYSHLSTSYIHPGIDGFSPDFGQKFPDNGYAKISKERVQQSVILMKRAFYYWDKVLESDPNYTPKIIENLRLKRANDYVHLYMNLMSVQEDELALHFLKEANYPEEYIQYAKIMLDNCGKNGFLFSNGDNDTFPLWYVQKHLKYRPDVIVMNTSLMQTEWYLTMNKKIYGYKTRFTFDDYKTFSTFYFYKYAQGTADFSQWLDSTIISINKEMPKEKYITMPNLTLKYGGADIELKFKQGTLWNIALFDILAKNPETQVNFTSGYAPYKLGMLEYSSNRGINTLLATNPPYSRTDAASIEALEGTLDKIDARELSTTYGINLYANLLYNVKALENDEEKYNSLVEGFSTKFKLSRKTQVNWNNAFVSLVHLYDKVKPELASEIRSMYQENALATIKSVSLNSFIENESKLKAIYEIYSGKSLRQQELDRTPLLTKGDHQVITELSEIWSNLQPNYEKGTRRKTSIALSVFTQDINGSEGE